MKQLPNRGSGKPLHLSHQLFHRYHRSEENRVTCISGLSVAHRPLEVQSRSSLAACVETQDERALAVFTEAIDKAQAMNRESVRNAAATAFDTGRIVGTIVEGLAGLASRIEAPAPL